MTRPTIFIVDDEPAVCDALSFLLRSEGFQVESYESAQAFLEAYEPHWSGCVLVDIHMPGMSGQEMLQVLTGRQIGLPVIVITGCGDGELAERLIREGVKDFIQKPFDRRELLEGIRRVVEEEE